jgi:hypothetical protein
LQDSIESPLADIIGPALDRQSPHLRITEKAGGRCNVLTKQLILEELGARRNDDGFFQASLSSCGGEGNYGRQICQRLPNPGPSLEQERFAPIEVSHEVSGEVDLLLPNPIARKICQPPFLIGENPCDRLFVEWHGIVLTVFDGNELERRFVIIAIRDERPLQDPEPGRLRRITVQRSARGQVSRFAQFGASSDPGEYSHRIEGVGQGPVLFLAVEQQAGKRCKSQIGRVGVSQGQDVLGVEKDRLLELLGDESLQEVTLEFCVVGDQYSPSQRFSDPVTNLAQFLGAPNIAVSDPGESLERRRQGPTRLN